MEKLELKEQEAQHKVAVTGEFLLYPLYNTGSGDSHTTAAVESIRVRCLG
jgi:hypothetical protein